MQLEFTLPELPEVFARDTVDRVNSGNVPLTASYKGKRIGTVIKGTAYLKDGRVQCTVQVSDELAAKALKIVLDS